MEQWSRYLAEQCDDEQVAVLLLNLRSEFAQYLSSMNARQLEGVVASINSVRWRSVANPRGHLQSIIRGTLLGLHHPNPRQAVVVVVDSACQPQPQPRPQTAELWPVAMTMTMTDTTTTTTTTTTNPPRLRDSAPVVTVHTAQRPASPPPLPQFAPSAPFAPSAICQFSEVELKILLATSQKAQCAAVQRAAHLAAALVVEKEQVAKLKAELLAAKRDIARSETQRLRTSVLAKQMIDETLGLQAYPQPAAKKQRCCSPDLK